MSVIPNSINVSNPIAPNFTDDTFALFDPIYGIGGLREVANLTERNNISAERLRVGMLVYVTSENQFYRLVSSSEDPVSFVTTTNWENVIFLNNNAQTISGVKTFSDGILFSDNNQTVGFLSGESNVNGNVNNLTLKVYPLNGEEGYLHLDYGVNDSSPSSRISIGEDGIRLSAGEVLINGTRSINLTADVNDINSAIYLNGRTQGNTGTFQKLYADNLVYNTGDQTISGVKSFQSGDFDNLIINYVLGVGEAKIKFGSNGYLLCNELDPIYTLGGVTPITLDAYNSAITLNNLSVSFNQYDLATYFGNKGEFVHFGLKNKFIHFYDYNSVLDQIEPNTQYNFKSGVSGSIPVDSEVVHITGDETISGQKTFKTRPTVNGSGVLLVGDNLGTSPSSSDTINVQTGNFYQLNTNNLVVSGTATFNNINLSEIDSVYVSGADVVIDYSGNDFFKITPTGILSNLPIVFGNNNVNSGASTNSIFGGYFNTIGITNSDSFIMHAAANNITSNFGSWNTINGGKSNDITSGSNNYIFGGLANEIKGENSYIMGGEFNFVSGSFQKLFTYGGTAIGDYSSLIGGTFNTIHGGQQNLILGGNYNDIFTSATTGINTIINSWRSAIQESSKTNLIINGAYNNASGDYNSIINGFSNTNYGRYNNVINGYDNSISGAYSTIINGKNNILNSSSSTVLCGSDNTISKDGSAVIGNKNYIDHSGAVLISDSTSRAKYSKDTNSLSIDFANGVYLENQVSIYDLRLRNKKYTDYSYRSSDFVFSTYMNIVNSTSPVNAILTFVEDTKNFFVKNINSGVLNITSDYLIDGQPSITLYKNESAEFMGIIRNGYTGWVIIGGNQGIN